LGVASAIVLLVVILVAYYCGGYVAGRMARFNGVKQGVGVWLWTIIAAVVVTILGLVAGDRFHVLSQLNSLPAVPVSGDALTTGAIISVVVIIVAALVGAVLGGLAGMRYHRRIDRATFTD
jgi:ABC-type dipeptide/oligopeptide/nickel transport system permease component